MGLFSSLWSGVKSVAKSAAAAVVKVAKSAAAAVVKVAKAVVRVVKEVGQWAKNVAVATARLVGEAIEDLGRRMQGKQRAELERLCSNLKEMLQRLQRQVNEEVTDFSQFARLAVFEDLLPRLVQVVGAAKHESEISSALRSFASEGLLLLDDPSSASDELLESIELLCEQYLKRTVDAVALERMVIVFDGNLEGEEERLRKLQAARRGAEVDRKEASIWIELGKQPRRTVEAINRQIDALTEDIGRATQRVSDLEMVSWAAEGLCQCEENGDAAELWEDEIAVIQKIVFDFYQRGANATLDADEQLRLHDAAGIFRGDAARRPEAREARESVEVGF
jgi:hypothetical protein